MPDMDKTLLDAKIAATTKARLTAESAFTTVATPASIVSLPVVVVKRRKVVVDSEGNDGSHGLAKENSAARSPKVHRIESNLREEVGKMVEPGVATTGVHSASLARDDGRLSGTKRRRQQKKHGDVTIIRQERPPASELAELRRKAMERYELVMAEIRKVDHQADAVRKVEAAKVVRWIRKAIVDYGLDAKDLGL